MFQFDVLFFIKPKYDKIMKFTSCMCMLFSHMPHKSFDDG